ADVQRNYVKTVRLTDPSPSQLRALFVPLRHAARVELRAEGIPVARCRIDASIDVRYRGQSYEIPLPLSARLRDDFHRAHKRLYGYADIDRPIEVVNLRVLATGRAAVSPWTRLMPDRRIQRVRLRVRWDDHWLDARLYLRSQMTPGSSLSGPAVIAEFSA